MWNRNHRRWILCSWTSFSLSLSLSITLSLSLSLHVFIYLYTHICQCYSCTTFSLFFSLCSGFVYSDFLFCFVFCFFFLLSLSLFLFTLFSFLLLFRYLGGGREKFLFIYENWVSLMQPLLSLTQTNSDWLFLYEWKVNSHILEIISKETQTQINLIFQ